MGSIPCSTIHRRPEFVFKVKLEKTDELFKTLEDYWETNKDRQIDQKELDEDIQEAVDYARSKLS